MKFNIKEINVLESNISPFLKVENEYRIRILHDRLSSSDFKMILSMVDSEKFLMLLIYNTGFRKHMSRKKYQLNRYFKITNWKEHFINDEEMPYPRRIIEVNNISKDEILKYYIGIMRGQVTPIVTSFLTNTTLLRFSPFYIDIVSEDVKLIESLRLKFNGIFEKEFEKIAPISEDEI
ncbi:hypothetical protein ACMGE9_10040 [Macrococcus sp. EM39E]|uniref:hypothetical protein n=1 Tax=Macrococcus animalis TaxID=3395467 RepID=UPI0039BE0177